FSADYAVLLLALAETEEFRQIMISESQYPSLQLADIEEEMKILRMEGSFLETDILVKLRDSMVNASDFLQFFRKREGEKYPELTRKAATIELDRNAVKQLDLWIDEKGRIRDNASPELALVRSTLQQKKSEVDKKLDKVFRQAKKEGWTEEGLEPTFRSGRMVIPLTATHKRKVKGFIHDESSTGHTVFLEPEEVFEVNNQIRELEFEERREIIKILVAIANYLRPMLPLIEEAFRFLAYLDFLSSKASFAIQTESYLPRLTREKGIEWIHARHPLLFLSHKAQHKPVVPLSIELSEVNRIVVISGPNAGGKSVCLKTVGLLQYMIQCGLLIPAKDGSRSGIFDRLFIDIGDEQSLENDLSTYSSHLLYMKYFMENADSSTLFLIDEFGSGTEPQVGGAMAETILEELNNSKAFGVVTTHYTNLKLMAGKYPGLINGAMTFDREKMEPLFKLETGKPGSSFAFEIARKIGLNEAILSKAAGLSGRAQFDFDDQLRELEKERKEIGEKNVKFRMADNFMAEIVEKYERMIRDLDNTRKYILDTAREESRKILSDTNKILESTIRQIRESQADKEKTRQLRQELDAEKQRIEKEAEVLASAQAPIEEIVAERRFKRPPKEAQAEKHSVSGLSNIPEEVRKEAEEKLRTPPPPPPPPKELPGEPIALGDWVKMTGQSTLGRVEEIRGKEATVGFGSVRLKCRKEMLVKVSQQEAEKFQRTSTPGKYGNILKDINERVAKFQPKIDLRGKRAEEALTELQQFIDEAILLEVFELRILHGKGDGILRELVRNYLQSVPEVKSYKDEILELGGHGITVVYFR
ncbi:MAG: Smr/MutS family protein, partial [Bacteroidetes bacterium]|nr:Smr/MutS family protein [Bacteroidota bacterium]